jgi:4-diphosphocytidyl-2-C-methyl-D-erythritol kinase
MLTEWAPAKVNLYLHVVGRRPDGYHRLDSLAVFAGIGDELRGEAADDLSLRVTGAHAAALQPEIDNLVLRAARALGAAAGMAPQARLVLDKRLPVAAGIGGGSADAAAALRLLVRLWGLQRIAGALPELGERLGADVPICLASRPARLGGIGERLAPAPALPPFGLVLANPGVPLATADIFRARTGPFSAAAALPAGWSHAAAMARDLAGLANDLQPPAVACCPAISEVLAALGALPNCLLARMSGSGATCFALFPDSSSARAAAARLPPRWWRWGGPPAPAPTTSTFGDPP